MTLQKPWTWLHIQIYYIHRIWILPEHQTRGYQTFRCLNSPSLCWRGRPRCPVKTTHTHAHNTGNIKADGQRWSNGMICNALCSMVSREGMWKDAVRCIDFQSQCLLSSKWCSMTYEQGHHDNITELQVKASYTVLNVRTIHIQKSPNSPRSIIY